MALGKMLGKEEFARLVVLVREQYMHSKHSRRWRACGRRSRRWHACGRRNRRRMGGHRRLSRCKHFLRDSRGQATVEMAVVFPVALILVVISFNAMNYLGICASFDRVFPQQVRVFAAAPRFGSNQGDAAASVQQALADKYAQECSNVSVVVSEDGWGNSVFEASFEYEPTFFGLQYRSILFGVQLPALSHRTSFALNCYRPGVIA